MLEQEELDRTIEAYICVIFVPPHWMTDEDIDGGGFDLFLKGRVNRDDMQPASIENGLIAYQEVLRRCDTNGTNVLVPACHSAIVDFMRKQMYQFKHGTVEVYGYSESYEAFLINY